MRQIEWVGTGSGLNPDLGNTAFFIRGEQNQTMLVDCGATVPTALMRKNQLAEVRHIVLTHTHSDHIGGLELVGFFDYFALKRRGSDRPNLYVGSLEFAQELWKGSLKAGMKHSADDSGNYMEAGLETYFQVRVGRNIELPDMPKLELVPTPHVPHMENYGVKIGDKVYYSGDTTSLPPHADLIFQDCQFFEGKGDVHISYQRLTEQLPAEIKKRTHLVHLGGGWGEKGLGERWIWRYGKARTKI